MRSGNYGEKTLGAAAGTQSQQRAQANSTLAKKSEGASPLDDLLSGPQAEQEAVAQANQRDGNGQTLLHHAAYRGDVKQVINLLALDGIELNAQDTINGDTPLHKATHGGHIAIVRLLNAAGANPGIGNSKGELPLHYAAHEGRPEIANELMLKIKTLGFSLDTKENTLGDTALHKAANSCHPKSAEVIKLFIANGAIFNIQDNKGETPGHYAAYRLDFKALRALEVGGANFNIPDFSGFLPIHKITQSARFVAKQQETSVLQKIFNAGAVLIHAKADVNGRDKDQGSALIHASLNKGLFAIIALRLLAADVNLPDAYGCLPSYKPQGDDEAAQKTRALLGKPQEYIDGLATTYQIDLTGAYRDSEDSSVALQG